VITLLAMDFGVTRRFIEVRLKKYGLLPQEMSFL
jgi:Zn-dependent peptidase ImmA (M78 family)